MLHSKGVEPLPKATGEASITAHLSGEAAVAISGFNSDHSKGFEVLVPSLAHASIFDGATVSGSLPDQRLQT